MSSKEIYRELCRSEASIPIFSQDWWLDAVCRNGDWDVVLTTKKLVGTNREVTHSDIEGTLPFYRVSPALIGMPKLTQTMGPWLRPVGFDHEKRLSHEKRVMFDLIKGLPSTKRFSQNFHYQITNWLPFYWRGFQQTTRYTYVINDISDPDAVYSRFNRAKKKNIKRAQREVMVRFDLTADEFYDNHVLTLAKSGEKISYSRDLFRAIYASAYDRSQGRVICASDSSGNIHAALFVVWDSMSAYDLVSTIDPEFRNSGASSLLVYKMIQYASGLVNKFDFEGSMIEGVENSFRQFGATQTPFFTVFRDSRSVYEKEFYRLGGIIKKRVGSLVRRHG